MRSSRYLFRFLKPYWKWAILAPLFMALEVAMDLMLPRMFQSIIDFGVARHDMAFVIHRCLLMFAFTCMGFVGGAGCTYFAMLAGQAFGADLRSAAFRKVQTFSFGNLDRIDTGALITRLTNDCSQVQELVQMLLRVMVRAPLLLIGSLVMAILTSAKLAMLFLGLIPFVLITLIFVINRMYPMFTQVQKRLDALNTVMQENLSGVRIVKAFARGDYEIERFGTVNNLLMMRNMTAIRLSAVTMPLMLLSLNSGIVATLWLGGINVKAGGLQVGQVIAFINYLMQTLMSLMFVSMLIIQVSRAEASAQRVKQVLDEKPVVRENPDAQSLDGVTGRVSFENVSFSYDSSDREAVLKNVSFTAEPGQTVALLGATGSGKSSLVNLIPRFYDVTSGCVALDGVDIRKLAEDSLRDTVKIALQDSVLFSGTIRDNIRYGCPDASGDDVVIAAKLAEADDFIRGLPDGYDTVVGQRGVNLSGGQKQRVAIARALLPKPRVLILDDSTSAVDMRTEAAIHAAIAGQEHRQTRFIVAQRISTVMNADKILILENGAIVAEGSHKHLLQTCPIYQEIYESQTESGAVNSDG